MSQPRTCEPETLATIVKMTDYKEDDLKLEDAIEKAPPSSPSSEQEPLDYDPVYTYAEQRKIIHRIDRRLITVAGIIYMNSLMDRSNLPNAAIAGMNEDLNITGNRYVSSIHDSNPEIHDTDS